MRKTLALAAAAACLAAPATALAEGNSTSGIDRYLSNPGYVHLDGAFNGECRGWGAGAFGYFGQDNSLAGGADGSQTGLNNSALCGAR